MMNCGAIASSTFIRPLDYVTGSAFAWSLWLLNSRYTGYAFEARRSSDNATTNVSFDKGVVTNSSAVSAGGNFGTWRGADTIFIRTQYDQSGNACNVVQTNTSLQFIYTDNHYLGRPSIRSVSNSYGQGTSTVLKNINSYSEYFRMYANNGAAGSNMILEGGNGTLSGLFTTANNNARFLYRSPYNNSGGDNIQSSNGTIPSATYFNYTGVRNGTAGTQTVWVNGGSSATLSSLAQPAWPNTNMLMTLCANGGSIGSGSLVGYIFAGTGFPYALNATQRAYLQANI